MIINFYKIVNNGDLKYRYGDHTGINFFEREKDAKEWASRMLEHFNIEEEAFDLYECNYKVEADLEVVIVMMLNRTSNIYSKYIGSIALGPEGKAYYE